MNDNPVMGKKEDGAAPAPAPAPAVVLEGGIGRPPCGKLPRFLMGVTGILLVKLIVLGAARFLLGFRRKGKISLSGAFVRIESETFLLGRSIRRSAVSITVRSVQLMEHVESAASAAVAGMALGLVAGVGAGFYFLVEWSLTRLGIYILLAFGCALAGIGLELLLGSYLPRLGRRSTLSITAARETTLLAGAPRDQVLAFIDAWMKAVKYFPFKTSLAGERCFKGELPSR